MKISYNWLGEYVQHSLYAAELSQVLTMCGLEVEEEISIGPNLEGVVVGHVLEVTRHPNADRLTVCTVDYGQEAPASVICGAPNVTANQKVAMATIGTRLTLPGKEKPIKIRRAKMRGVWSEGMLCAEDELGLSDDHSGILVLGSEAVPGTSLEQHLVETGQVARDTVLDLAITPNRPDAICHLGVARDVAALRDAPLHRPRVFMPEVGGDVAKHVSVSIECPDKCRRYVALMVNGVTVGESPRWLQQRLEAIGLRPINNVVDITNFVMYECGQPLHGFDYDTLAKQSIVVRESVPGESFVTLDGKERNLPLGSVLICDGEKPVAIGGIMGGENSEVTATTTTVLIESAYFDPSATRRTARALGLSTDASYRFERGVDSDGQVWAAARAASLMADLAGGTVVRGMVDCHPNPVSMPTVELRFDRIQTILGITVPHDEVVRILTALGFGTKPAGPGALKVTVPPNRPDVSLEIDLIEEVARIHGLDNIPTPGATMLPGHVPSARPYDVLRAKTYEVLCGRGYREIYTNSLLPRAEAEVFCDPVLGAAGGVAETINAVSRSMTSLRPSLVPGALAAMGHNQNHGQDALRFFEFGHVFYKVDEDAAYVPGYQEFDALILAISGAAGPPEWDGQPRMVDYYDLKGDVETLLDSLRVPHVRLEPVARPSALTAFHTIIRAGRTEIGRMAQLDADVTADRDIKQPVLVAEFNWTRLVLHTQDHLSYQYQPINRYPAVLRDLSVIVDCSVTAMDMLQTMRSAGRPLIQDAHVFDLYEGKELGAGKKSLAFSLRFGAQRTLRDHEVDKAIADIMLALNDHFGAEIRGPVG